MGSDIAEGLPPSDGARSRGSSIADLTAVFGASDSARGRSSTLSEAGLTTVPLSTSGLSADGFSPEGL